MIALMLLAACGAPPPLAIPPRPANAPAHPKWAETAGYRPIPLGDGWLLASPVLDLRADVGPSGVVLRGAHYTVTGVGVALAGAPPGAPILGPCLTEPDPGGRCVHRVDQRRGPGLSEWWENLPDGLVHGVLADPPAGGGPVVVTLAVSGATVDLGAGDPRLVRPHGLPVRIADIVAWDAGGRPFPVTVGGTPTELQLTVDAAGPVALEMRFVPGIWSIASEAGSTSADVNGDRMGDLLVGRRVHHGSRAGLATAAAWTTERGRGLTASVGDIDGDGFEDVATPGPSQLFPLAWTASVELWRGSPAGLAREPGWTVVVQGNQPDVAAAGDVDGDGYDDLVTTDGGRHAAVYLGSGAGPEPTPTWKFEVAATGKHSDGISVASAGDTNGDGYGDLLVGAPQYDHSILGRGRAYLFLGSPRGLSEGAAWSLQGDSENAGFGASVAGAGDVNRDGYADILVGAPGGAFGAYLYLGSAAGPATEPAWTALPGPARSESTRQVAAAGDADHDGFADVLVCASDAGAQGRAILYLGGKAGLSSEPAWTATTAGPLHCAAAGDVDGDTHDDWIVSSGGRVSVHSLPWRRPMK